MGLWIKIWTHCSYLRKPCNIYLFRAYISEGREIGIFGSLIRSKPWWNWYLTPVVNFVEVQRAQLARSTLLTTLVPLGSFKICSDAKEGEWGAKSNGKLPHLFIPSKTATLVPGFAVEDLPLCNNNNNNNNNNVLFNQLLRIFTYASNIQSSLKKDAKSWNALP